MLTNPGITIQIERQIGVEVKSSNRKQHESIDAFCQKYFRQIREAYLFSQKDVAFENKLIHKPIYMIPFVLEDLLE